MHRTLLAECLAVSLALLTGCASPVNLQQVAAPSALTPAIIPGSPFQLQSMVPPPGTYKHLRVYIEGDGHAWATSSQPSTDPTPHESLMAKYAAEDTQPAAYLARPCQFIMSPGCGIKTWTADRFSSEVMASMNTALDSLKHRFQVERFELVGHSGGGEVALVLAGMRDDVASVQTIAGNIDPIAWTRIHGLTPLNGPVTPLQFKNRLTMVPQRHIIGTADKVVPAAIAQSYAAQLNSACLEIVEAPASHNDGYDHAWRELSSTPLRCKQ